MAAKRISSELSLMTRERRKKLKMGLEGIADTESSQRAVKCFQNKKQRTGNGDPRSRSHTVINRSHVFGSRSYTPFKKDVSSTAL